MEMALTAWMGKAPENAKFWEDSWFMKDTNTTQ
jgi:hypothetical protein